MIDHDVMRIKNLSQIFEQIRTSGTDKTKKELQEQTELSWATVSGSINWLLHRGFISEIGNGSSQKAGRPAKGYDISSSCNLLIGVDINVESIHVVIIDMKCRVLFSLNRMLIADDRDSVLGITKDMIYTVIDDSQIDKNAILGIGFAIMGAVDTTRGISRFVHLIKNWQDVDIKGIFEKEFGLPVLVEHDPNCQAIAEMNVGAGILCKNFIFLRISLGIGMGQVINSQVYKGGDGNSGEIGHVCMDREGPLCYCGKRGCVEAYASISGIARRFTEATSGSYGLTGRNSEKDLAIVHRLAMAAVSGDPEAKSYFNTAADILGIAIGNILSVNNPSLVIIGGAFSQYSNLFLDRLKEVAYDVCWPYAKVDIELSTLPPNAAANGAASLFIQNKIWETLF